MQGQCTRCRRALGRTREGKKSSSWCWLQLFSAARLVGQSAPLPSLCCAGWLTRPDEPRPLDERWKHWRRRGGGIPRAKQAEELRTRVGLPPGGGGGFLSRCTLILFAALDAGLRAAFQSARLYRCITVVENEQNNVPPMPIAIAKAAVSRDLLATLADLRMGDCWFANWR